MIQTNASLDVMCDDTLIKNMEKPGNKPPYVASFQPRGKYNKKEVRNSMPKKPNVVSPECIDKHHMPCLSLSLPRPT